MAEKIGLEGVFDLSDWDRGVQSYLGSIDRMVGASGKFAGGVASEYGKLGGVIAGVAAAAVSAAAVMAGAAAKATVSWVGEGVEKAQQLESQISGIAAVMGITKSEAEPLAEVIRNLSIDPALKVNTFEAADAIELLARNGMSMSDIMAGAARNTVLLANATDAEFGTAADIATDVMSIFNIQAEDMMQAVNGITAVVNNSKFDINDYALALARGGVSAAAAGVNFDDFNAIIAFSAASFSSGQTAGTGWANLLTRMVPQSESAAEAMRELGIITADGANRFFNADGSAKGLAERIDILNEAFGGLSTEQRTNYAQMIFGRDAANALNSVIGKTGEEFVNFKGIMGQTDAEESARTRMDNLAGVMEILRGIVEAVQIQVGEKFLPVLQELGRVLSEVLDDKSEVLVDMFTGIADWAARAGEALVPLIQERLPVLIDNAAAVVKWLVEWLNTGQGLNEHIAAMSEPVQAWVTRIVELVAAFQEITGNIGAFMGQVQAALAPVAEFLAQHITMQDVMIAAAGAVLAFLAPLALAIAKMAAVGAAAALAVAAIRSAWEENLGGVRDYIAETWQRIQGIVEVGHQILAEIFGKGGSNLNSVAKQVWEGIKQTISSVLDAIRGVLEVVLALIRGDWEGAWEKIKEVVGVVLDAIKAIIDGRLQLLSTVFGEGMGKIQALAQRIWAAIQDIVETVLGLIEGFIEAHGETILKVLKWAWDDAVAIIEDAMEVIALVLEAVAALLKGDWTTAWEKGAEAATKALTTVHDAIQRRFELWSELLAGKGNEVATWFKETFPKASEAMERALEKLGETWQELSDAWMGLMEKLQEATGKFLETLAQWWEEHGDTVMAIVDTLIALLIESFTNMADAITSLLTAFLLLLQGDWEGAWTEMKDVFEAIWNQIVAIAKAVWDVLQLTIGNSLAELGRKMQEGAQNAVNQFMSGLADLGTRAAAAVQGAISAMTAPFANLGSTMYQQGQNAVQGFTNGISGAIGQAQAKVGELAGVVSQVMGLKLEIQSPSRLTKKFGRLTGEGFVLGLEDMFTRVQAAVGHMAALLSDGLGDLALAPAGSGSTAAAALRTPEVDLGRILQQRLSGASMAGPTQMMQSYANSTTNNHQFGPITVNTPVDLAELEYRFSRIMDRAL